MTSKPKNLDKKPENPTPKASSSTERKKIIEDEIALEEKRLDEAKAKVADLTRKSSRFGKNSASELEEAQKSEALHQKNIEILKRELAR